MIHLKLFLMIGCDGSRAHVYACRACVRGCVGACLCVCVHACVRACLCVCVHACVRACLCVCVCVLHSRIIFTQPPPISTMESSTLITSSNLHPPICHLPVVCVYTEMSLLSPNTHSPRGAEKRSLINRDVLIR